MVRLPDDFITCTQQLMGEERYARFVKSFDDDPCVSVRVNPFKSSVPVDCQQVPWCSNGFYLDRRPNFTFDPLFHAGAYYVQEAASMFLDRVIRQYVDKPVKALDLCAAPGGKTTILRTALPEGSTLFANEPVRLRAQVLSENMQKFGHPEMVVTNNFPKDYAASGLRFDVILCDVPCSGEGMFRKDNDAIGEWSRQNVATCSKLQREIADEAWRCLNQDGLLIYSTCTFNAEEDERNVKAICEKYDAELLCVDTRDEWNVTPSLLEGFTQPVYRFIPGISRGEGLFMAVLRKRGGEDIPTVSKREGKKRNKKDAPSRVPKELPSWVDSPADYSFTAKGDRFFAIPLSMKEQYETAESKLHVIHAGIALGTQKGKDIVPDTSLALSIALAKTAFPHVELDYKQAVSFLRKETVTLDEGVGRGYAVVAFRSMPLGFVKNLGNRANNLYPSEWKIKSSHVPEEYAAIVRKPNSHNPIPKPMC